MAGKQQLLILPFLVLSINKGIFIFCKIIKLFFLKPFCPKNLFRISSNQPYEKMYLLPFPWNQEQKITSLMTSYLRWGGGQGTYGKSVPSYQKPCDSMWTTCGLPAIEGSPHAAHMESQGFCQLGCIATLLFAYLVLRDAD